MTWKQGRNQRSKTKENRKVTLVLDSNHAYSAVEPIYQTNNKRSYNLQPYKRKSATRPSQENEHRHKTKTRKHRNSILQNNRENGI